MTRGFPASMLFKKSKDDKTYEVTYMVKTLGSTERYSLPAKDDDEALTKALNYAVENLHSGKPLMLKSMDRLDDQNRVPLPLDQALIMEQGIKHIPLKSGEFKRLEDHIR
jgi:hypothetical protein